MALKFKCPECCELVFVKYLKVNESAKCQSCEVNVRVPEDAVSVDDSEVPSMIKPRSQQGNSGRVREDIPLKGSRPTWATIVGIIGIVIGCFGTVGGGSLMMFPAMIEMQKEMLSSMQEFFEAQETTDPQQIIPDNMFKIMEEMWNVPDWFDTYCVVAGIIALFISGFYIFASIRLLQVKPTAIKLYYTATGIIISFTILKAIITLAAISLMGLVMMGGFLSLVIHVVLLIVVSTGEKDAFTTQDA